MIRPTTNGVLKSYRFNLRRSTNSLNKCRDTVLTGKQFSSFAEDPAAVSRSFHMRSSMLRVDSQHNIGQSAVRKFEVAWSTLDQVMGNVNSAKEAVLRAANDPTGAGINALGQELSQIAEGIVRTMNVKFGDNFVFAGSDGLNPPMELKGSTLTYRGIDVSTTDPGELETLRYLTEEEKKFADIGLGLEEDADGNLIESSAFNVALQATTFLGYGHDDDGDPKNVACIIKELSDILVNDVDANGGFKNGKKEVFNRLAGKLENALASLSNNHTNLDTKASFLKQNQKQLESSFYDLSEQIAELENVDPADAITAFSWAQYCYNSALKVGNNILSQSLMDYLNH